MDNHLDELAKYLVTINLATLITILGIGFKIISFINEIKFKVNLMWDDFQRNKSGHYRRHYDNKIERDEE